MYLSGEKITADSSECLLMQPNAGQDAFKLARFNFDMKTHDDITALRRVALS